MTCRDGAPPRQGGQRARERRDKATGQAPGSRAWPSPGVVGQAGGQPSSRRVGGSCKKRPREPFCGSFPNSTSLRLHLPLRRPGLVLGPTPGTCGGRRRGPSGAGAVPRGRWAVRAEGRSQDAPTTPRKRQSAGLLLRKSDAKRRPRTCQEQQGGPAHQHGRRLEPSAPRGDVRGNSSTDEGPGAPEGNSACRVSDRTRTQPGQPSAGSARFLPPAPPVGGGVRCTPAPDASATETVLLRTRTRSRNKASNRLACCTRAPGRPSALCAYLSAFTEHVSHIPSTVIELETRE